MPDTPLPGDVTPTVRFRPATGEFFVDLVPVAVPTPVPPPVPPPPVPPPPPVVPPSPPAPPPSPPAPPPPPPDPRVTITPDTITTPWDTIPNFGGHPTLTAVRSGPWSDPATWGGKLPVAGEVVSIPAGVTVAYDQQSDTKLDTVSVAGTLIVPPDTPIRLRTTNLLVLPGGTLTVGTPTAPVTASAEIVINDVPLDTTRDPAQYGHGLIALGTVTMNGAEKTPFVRVNREPKAGDTSLSLAEPVAGWAVGDKLILPDTRHLTEGERWAAYVPQWETAAVASVSADGLTVTLAAPLKFDHPAARDPDGLVRFFPHAGNLTRNVVIRSENVTGTRGHTLFTRRADIDIRYATFGGLGRTKNLADDNTTYDAAGTVTHVGTNQMGRYPVHFRHLDGPAGLPAGTPQFTFTGNGVYCPLDPMPYRWGVVLDGSSYGSVSDNVIHNWAGAGLACASGAESYNLIRHNFVVGVRGDASPRDGTGRDGSAYWSLGFNNHFVGNVAADAVGSAQGVVSGSGYYLAWAPASAANTPVPLSPGADTSDPAQVVLIDMQVTPVLEFAGNEAYGATACGLSLWQLGTDGGRVRVIGRSAIQDFAAWHVWEEGFFGYPVNNVLFDGFTVIGHPRVLANPDNGGRGLAASDYILNDVTIRRADIQGMRTGITYATAVQGTFVVQDSHFRNYAGNIDVDMAATAGTRENSFSPMPARTTRIDNTRFDPYPGAPSFTAVRMAYNAGAGGGVSFVRPDEVLVTSFNGVAGDDFRVFYAEQAADFVVPQTAYYGPDENGDGKPDWVNNAGCPEAGLTNEQAWAKYNPDGTVKPDAPNPATPGLAVAGAVVPAGATTRDGVAGLVVKAG